MEACAKNGFDGLGIPMTEGVNSEDTQEEGLMQGVHVLPLPTS